MRWVLMLLSRENIDHGRARLDWLNAAIQDDNSFSFEKKVDICIVFSGNNYHDW
jgi:hypothetical protein